MRAMASLSVFSIVVISLFQFIESLMLKSRSISNHLHESATTKNTHSFHQSLVSPTSVCTLCKDLSLFDSIEGYSPPEVGPEIYAGSIIALIPIIWASYEFISRLVIQRRCLVCNGSGISLVTRQGTVLSKPRKCWACGGFLPWMGWKLFLSTSVDDVGNGGPLQRPAKDFEDVNRRVASGDLKLPNISVADYYKNKKKNSKRDE